ncbi:MAG: hypothetical protein AAGK93_04080, partial [Pseudomonadota bacterium]
MYEMLMQTLWATIILFSAFVCFESFRFDTQPLRFIAHEVVDWETLKHGRHFPQLVEAVQDCNHHRDEAYE